VSQVKIHIKSRLPNVSIQTNASENLEYVILEERKLYRVGQNFETRANTLTENPYESPKVGPKFGATLYNIR
jgi:hypothetical protein